MRHNLAALLIAAALPACTSDAAAPRQPAAPVTSTGQASSQPAVDAASAWLALVDVGEHGRSWDEAATLFRNAVPKNDWERSLDGVRRPLGKVLSRKLATATPTESLPGAPDGQYVVLRYETSFENKKTAIETVTPMLDQDGDWRVSGYYIR